MKRSEKIQLSEKDYDIYDIPLPLAVLWKNQKDKHLSYELGKIHPCFSDDCRFDSKVSITRKGFKAKVLVVNNYVLKNYEEKLKTGRLYSAEFKKKPLFCKKLWNLKKIIFLCGFTALFSIFCFFSFGKTEEKIEAANVINKTEKSNESKKIEPALDLLKSFLACVKFNNGRINSFEWKTNGFSEEIKANLKNLYPESLNILHKDLNFSALSFSKEIPGFTVTGKSSVSLGLKQRQNNDFPRNEIRELIRNYDGNLFSETVTPYEIKFEIKKKSDKSIGDFFSKLDEICRANELFPEQIQISDSGKNKMEMFISFSDFFPEEKIFPFSVMGDYIITFVNFDSEIKDKKDNPVEKKNENNSKEIKTEKLNQKKDSTEKPIGKVIHEDGSVTAFYKNKDGKIEIKNQ